MRWEKSFLSSKHFSIIYDTSLHEKSSWNTYLCLPLKCQTLREESIEAVNKNAKMTHWVNRRMVHMATNAKAFIIILLVFIYFFAFAYLPLKLLITLESH